MNTLPDYLEHNLRIISIGLNPSPVSVQAGYYFANPRNRFWKALNASRLVDEPLQPSEEAMRRMFVKYRIGFTDLVKKPTRMGNQLRAADYREGAPVLKNKLMYYQPAIAWFHGKDTYRNFLKYAEDKEVEIPWAAQKHILGKTRIFVTPNPSPANAAYSLEDLIRYYNEMVSFMVREAFGLGIR
jgi:TDG/mug DNA glycosylase family protein